MTTDNGESTYQNVREDVLLVLADQLDETKDGEVYFHDLIHETVDYHAEGWNRQDCIDLIDWTGNEDYVESYLYENHNGLTHLLRIIAFECVRIEFFDEDLFQELQSEMNNEILTSDEAEELAAMIREEVAGK